MLSRKDILSGIIMERMEVNSCRLHFRLPVFADGACKRLGGGHLKRIILLSEWGGLVLYSGTLAQRLIA